MAWLRIDDGFDTHPKILALGSDQRRWTWCRILVYTCRYRSPEIPGNVTDLIPRATKKFLSECVELGLVDRTDEGTLVVHDWDEYQAGDPKKAARQRRWRNANVDADVDGNVDASVDGLVDASRAGARTEPVPSPKRDTSTEASLLPLRPRDEIWDALETELGPVATKSERGKRNQAVKQLRDIGATQDEIQHKCRAYRLRWPGIDITDQALVAHWSKLELALPQGRALSAGDLFAIADQLGAKELGA